jgi:predicted dehydrogenase
LRSEQNILRVALIGAGRFGSKRAAALSKSCRSSLVVVADTNLEAAGALSRQFGGVATSDWARSVTREDVDAVIVSTPTHRLAEVSLLAARAGKHVLAEKPFGRSPNEVSTVVEAARVSGVCLKAGYNHRYHPALREAYACFTKGAIGRPLTAHCFYGHGGRIGYEREWRSQIDLSGGGQLLDQGVHALDLFRWFLGDFEEVNAMVATAFWPITPAEDNVFATMRSASGAIAQLHASWTFWKNKFSFTLIGEKGYLTVEGLGGSYGPERLCVGVREIPGDVPKEQWIDFSGGDDSLELEWEDFLDSIDEGSAPMSSGDEALRTLLLVDAIYRAAKEQRTIRVEAARQPGAAGIVQRRGA